MLSLLVTVTLVAWGVLVFAAIEFGRDARSGDSQAWTFLALAAAGATACLFVTMILGARLVGAGAGAYRGHLPRVPAARWATRGSLRAWRSARLGVPVLSVVERRLRL